ncbi:hypothetical protein AVL59_20820 [Streptomyces griseochromogenes]|uniref:Secreted protein n=1 Tax=Streptomyces griseochromogenes TaxID=68214 RepID=A0A1B1AYP7_9ACTN|nr:hypothetical protein AVL59_20820 [Streptomyces griseochromogenes]
MSAASTTRCFLMSAIFSRFSLISDFWYADSTANHTPTTFTFPLQATSVSACAISADVGSGALMEGRSAAFKGSARWYPCAFMQADQREKTALTRESARESSKLFPLIVLVVLSAADSEPRTLPL